MLRSDLLDSLAGIALQSLRRADGIPRSPLATRTGALECTSWRSNGFSDSAIYRLATDMGVFAIRSWPNRFDTADKVAFWSRTNQSFANDKDPFTRTGAIHPTPFPRLVEWQSSSSSVGLLLPFADKLWTLCDWVAGTPITANTVSKTTVQHLASILGRLHADSSQAFRSADSPAAKQTLRSNSLRERHELLKSMDYRLLTSCDPTHFFANNQLLENVKHCLAIVLERHPSWLRFLSICESQERDCHWIVRDLWSENILVDERQRFSSIVDLGAARLDWPGLDFVRLFGSLRYGAEAPTVDAGGPRDEGLWTDAYVAYTRSHTDHAIASLDECKMLHQVSLGLSIVQWVLWNRAGSIETTHSDKAHRVSNRIAGLCNALLADVR